MEHVSELTDILNGYLGWNKARIGCFVNMLLALICMPLKIPGCQLKRFQELFKSCLAKAIC